MMLTLRKEFSEKKFLNLLCFSLRVAVVFKYLSLLDAT